MSFNTFCNICFIKEHIIKLCVEENESIFNILISFASSTDTVNGIIYLCTNCCNKLEEYNKLRQLFLTNFIRFRYLYNELKKQLEIRNAPDIENQLKAFVEVNVERPSGTPLIENHESVFALRNNTESNVDICKESVKYENDCFTEEQENINGSFVYVKGEPTSFDETYNALTNTDTVATSISFSSSAFNEKDKPNPDRFEESDDPLVNDSVANVIPCHDTEDDDISEASHNPEDCVTIESTDEEGPTNQELKATKSVAVDNVCDEDFSYNNGLEVRIRPRTGEKHYVCDVCLKEFTNTTKLKIHKRLHSGKGPYKCDECTLRFTHRSNLNRHKLTHTGEKPFKCEYCGLGFTRRDHLNRHKLTHTGEKPFKCDECDLGFTQSDYLKRHKRTHTGEKSYSCDECHKTFRDSVKFIEHKNIHSGEKPYKCDKCGLGFAQVKQLTRHKLTHSNERPYSCDECHNAFKEKSTLVVHKRTHTGEKPYKCEECGMRFTKGTDLNRHLRTHTDERPYSCDECHKSFKQHFNLIIHKRIHSN